MDVNQINFIRSKGIVASVITTRNALYLTADQKGQPGPGARYEIVEWDDANELLVLKNTSAMNPNQIVPLTIVSYGPIDEMQIIEP